MPISINPQMMREIIMDHYNNPLHKSTPSDKENYLSIRMDSDSCIDDITIYLKIENDIVVKTYFDGIACTISTASTDILCDLILNKSKTDALYILEQYTNMIFEKEYKINLRLLGRYNLSNLLGAIGAVKTLGLSDEEIISKICCRLRYLF